jgi:nucleotide-binding universal stress UspA family protein
MFNNLLLAVDGSNYTDGILKTGIYLAKAFNSQIHLLTVADIRVFEWATAVGADGFVPIVPSGIYQEESKKILDEKCDKILEKCSQILNEEQIKFQTHQLVGSPADTILDHLHVADLLIMGKRGEFSSWEKKTLGATTETVSRGSFKPMLVTEKEFKPFKNILIGYDGSKHANNMLLYVAHLAEALNSNVKILCVCNDSELGKGNCKEAKEYLSSYKLEANFEILKGHPDEKITEFATENNYDLIAIGAYGNSRIKEAILGSTTEHILRFSKTSVLLAK